MSIAAKALARSEAPGYYWPMVRLSRVIIGSAGLALLAVALPAPAEALNAFDREVMEFVARNRSLHLDGLMSDLSSQWSKQNLALAALVITARGNEQAFGAAEECTKAIAVSEMIVGPLKYAINRKRPEGKTSRANSSFPSSHAATAFAAASALGRAYPKMRIPALAAAALISYSRLYEGRHYATDVIAGACVGFAAEAVSRAYLGRLHLDRARVVARLPLRIDFQGEGRGLIRIYLSARM
jgi:undecaprenyl-diphosphatase